MPSPSILGDLGHQVTAVYPLSTSTAIFYIRTSGTDTGTVVTTGRTFDFARLLHQGSTGGKPLDATVHPRSTGAPRFQSVTVAVPLELTYHTSGLNSYVTVAHKTRATASGAGSTWETLKTDVKRFKMGTDTDATFHVGFASSVSAQAIKRFYKANITFTRKLGSSTAAKDTTTAGSPLICNSPVVILSGAAQPTTVPKTV